MKKQNPTMKQEIKEVQKLAVAHTKLLEELVKTIQYMDKKIDEIDSRAMDMQNGINRSKKTPDEI